MQDAQPGDHDLLEEAGQLGELLGPIYTWWQSDPLARLPPLPNFVVEPTDNYHVIATLGQLDIGEVLRRADAGHRPYLAWWNGAPVAYGWSASKHATIGALGLDFDVPPADRYLWDFATLPSWRGRGVYPRLLQAVLGHEKGDAERFWIGHDLGNVASQRGILKAGFRPVGALYRRPVGTLGLSPTGPLERARAGARLLGIPLFR